MRVITNLGLGTVDDWPENPNQIVKVNLDPPRREEKVIKLREEPQKFLRRNVFPLADYAVVRVVNVTNLGIVSSLQFYDSAVSAKAVFDDPKPSDETRFLLNLKDLTFQLNYELGFAVENYLWLQPWVDRWGIERSGYPESDEPTLEKFDAWKEETAGTTGGIFAPVFLDIPKRRILRFCIAVTAPYGVVHITGTKKKKLDR